MDTVAFSKSQRNRPIAISLGYIYNLHRVSNEKQDWRCKEYFKNKRPATIQTKGDILLKSKYIHNHSCDPDETILYMKPVHPGFSSSSMHRNVWNHMVFRIESFECNVIFGYQL